MAIKGVSQKGARMVVVGVVLSMVFWAASVEAVTIPIQVSKNGFATETGTRINSKHPLYVPAGEIVTLKFQFAEEPYTLAYGDVHVITLRNLTTGEVSESIELWMFVPEAFVAFGSGPSGTKHHGFCTRDCLGMGKLQTLLIIAR